MGIATYPAAAGGGIKSVQRGLASASGTVTITSVDISKSFVTIFGTTSSGTVAATGAINAASGSTSTSTQPVPAGYVYDSTSGQWRLITNNRLTTGNTGGGTTAFVNNDINMANTAIVNVISTANAMNVSLNATNITGGTNNLVSAVIQGYLSNSTSLVVSGACRWEVVEFA